MPEVRIEGYQQVYQALVNNPPNDSEPPSPDEFHRMWQQMTPLQRLLLGAKVLLEDAA